jgi:hypothetical protein
MNSAKRKDVQFSNGGSIAARDDHLVLLYVFDSVDVAQSSQSLGLQGRYRADHCHRHDPQ